MVKKKTVLITGCTSGIGYELAELFAQDGYNLVLVSRNKSKLLTQKRKYEAKKLDVLSLAIDLSKPDAANKVYKALKDTRIDVLVNNAGFGDYAKFVDADWKKLEGMMNLNMLTLTKLTHLLLPRMISRKHGRILNVASVAAFMPGPLMAVYFATKAYVHSFSQALAKELEGTGITVTSLCPGPTASHFQKRAHMQESYMVKDKKLPSSQEVAEYGYDALMKGKLVAVHGLSNKILSLLSFFLPRRWKLDIIYNLQKK